MELRIIDSNYNTVYRELLNINNINLEAYDIEKENDKNIKDILINNEVNNVLSLIKNDIENKTVIFIHNFILYDHISYYNICNRNQESDYIINIETINFSCNKIINNTSNTKNITLIINNLEINENISVGFKNLNITIKNLNNNGKLVFINCNITNNNQNIDFNNDNIVNIDSSLSMNGGSVNILRKLPEKILGNIFNNTSKFVPFLNTMSQTRNLDRLQDNTNHSIFSQNTNTNFMDNIDLSFNDVIGEETLKNYFETLSEDKISCINLKDETGQNIENILKLFNNQVISPLIKKYIVLKVNDNIESIFENISKNNSNVKSNEETNIMIINKNNIQNPNINPEILNKISKIKSINSFISESGSDNNHNNNEEQRKKQEEQRKKQEEAQLQTRRQEEKQKAQAQKKEAGTQDDIWINLVLEQQKRELEESNRKMAKIFRNNYTDDVKDEEILRIENNKQQTDKIYKQGGSSDALIITDGIDKDYFINMFNIMTLMFVFRDQNYMEILSLCNFIFDEDKKDNINKIFFDIINFINNREINLINNDIICILKLSNHFDFINNNEYNNLIEDTEKLEKIKNNILEDFNNVYRIRDSSTNKKYIKKQDVINKLNNNINKLKYKNKHYVMPIELLINHINNNQNGGNTNNKNLLEIIGYDKKHIYDNMINLIRNDNEKIKIYTKSIKLFLNYINNL